MDPVLGAALLGGGANIAGQAINYFATKDLNKETRLWNEQMYNRQFNDNVKLWRLQNEYNSPENQKQRLINAGLNPAMMYGGSGGGGVAASPIQSAKPNSWNPTPPQVDPQSFLQSIYQLPLAGAQTKERQAKARMEDMRTTIYETFFSDGSWGRGIRAEWNIAIKNAEIRNKENINWQERYDEQLKEIISRSKLNDARRWYEEANKLLYEETGMLLTDDFFYRNIIKDGVDETDKFIINLVSVLKMVAAPFKLGR